LSYDDGNLVDISDLVFQSLYGLVEM